MAANISVMGGVNDDMGGVTESVGKFNLHNKEVADALLNVSGIGTATGAPVHYMTPRPSQTMQEFPFMLHHADGSHVVVNSAAERDEQKGYGYRVQPYPPVRVNLNDPKTEKIELERKLAYQMQVATAQEDVIRQMNERLQALEVDNNRAEIAEKKRGK